LTRVDLPRLLDCMAVSDVLDGLVVYGASGTDLRALADGLAERLRATSSTATDQVWLGPADTEDGLWGMAELELLPGWGGRGKLVPPDGTTRIVIVADLSRLSLAAARAGVTMLGSPVVQIERRGCSRRLEVRHKWIAALSDEDRGTVSRHLLDRFAIRVPFTAEVELDRRAWLSSQLSGSLSGPNPFSRSGPLSPAAAVDLDSSAVERALACVEGSPSQGMRPALALLRVAEAVARLDRESRVDGGSVLSAARALGFAPPARPPQPPGPTEPPGPEERDALEPERKERVPSVRRDESIVTPVGQGPPKAVDAVRPPRDDDVFVSPAAVPDAAEILLQPEPVDATPAPREYATLRLPWQQARNASSGHGAVIGTRRTESLCDLAVIETILAALPFQPLRRKATGRSGMILLRSDLRSYRRAPPTGDLFVLLIDYTSVAGRKWLHALVPFLADAYSARAELCLVRVGSASAAHELRADRIMARNILVPSVAAALDEKAGKATPLADGLSIAQATIRQTLGHGRSTARRATLVVVTDGRGNVPLEASREGRWPGRVGRQGIEDSIAVARSLRDLPRVKCKLVNPQPQDLRELPLGLANALGAEVVRA
jgi:magnesium chelatase subunit D